MILMELTEEQRQLVAAAEGKPVDVIDPRTRQAYVLLPAEVYQRVRTMVEGPAAEGRRPERTPEQRPLPVRVRDLPAPPEVAERVKQLCKKLGFWRRRYVADVEEELKLQYHFGGQYVGLLPSREGPLVVAAGVLDGAFDRQLATLSPADRRQVLLLAVDRWDDTASLILSPLPTHEG